MKRLMVTERIISSPLAQRNVSIQGKAQLVYKKSLTHVALRLDCIFVDFLTNPLI